MLSLSFVFVFAHRGIPTIQIQCLVLIDEAEETGKLQTMWGPVGSAFISIFASFFQHFTIYGENQEKRLPFFHLAQAQKGGGCVAVPPHGCLCICVAVSKVNRKNPDHYLIHGAIGEINLRHNFSNCDFALLYIVGEGRNLERQFQDAYLLYYLW